ncbi:MAG: hypothetical protein BWZ10_02774 [candidate division BRC1 bacterium ADurb.BinA364]|nr:MAG: hypothetical protein BWZ10_02774 [candidate division BRC1 bacterium ADurb.BinA364]
MGPCPPAADETREIDRSGGSVAYLAWLDRARPAENARHANAAFPKRAFAAAKPSRRSGSDRAVVAGIDREGIVADAQTVERAHQPPDLVVDMAEIAQIFGQGRRLLLPLGGIRSIAFRVAKSRAIGSGEFLGSGNHAMGLLEPDEQAERPSGVRTALQPLNGFVHDNGRRIALDLAAFHSVADEGRRIQMAGDGIVLGRQPIVEAVVVGLRLIAGQAAVGSPLADETGVVARIAQHGADGALFALQMHRRIVGDVGIDAEPERIATCQNARSRRRARSGRRIEIGKSNPFGRHAVDIRRRYAVAAVASQIAIALVVGHEDHDVGLARLLGAQAPGGQQSRPRSGGDAQKKAPIDRFVSHGHNLPVNLDRSGKRRRAQANLERAREGEGKSLRINSALGQEKANKNKQLEMAFRGTIVSMDFAHRLRHRLV